MACVTQFPLITYSTPTCAGVIIRFSACIRLRMLSTTRTTRAGGSFADDDWAITAPDPRAPGPRSTGWYRRRLYSRMNSLGPGHRPGFSAALSRAGCRFTPPGSRGRPLAEQLVGRTVDVVVDGPELAEHLLARIDRPHHLQDDRGRPSNAATSRCEPHPRSGLGDRLWAATPSIAANNIGSIRLFNQ